jgi:hypothetical protein
VQADDGFLEAILSFVVSVPMADIWQDDAWREQQLRLLTAQFGPKEVESLSVNAVLPIDLDNGQKPPLEWMQSKELRELQVTIILLCQPTSQRYKWLPSSTPLNVVR